MAKTVCQVLPMFMNSFVLPKSHFMEDKSFAKKVTGVHLDLDGAPAQWSSGGGDRYKITSKRKRSTALAAFCSVLSPDIQTDLAPFLFFWKQKGKRLSVNKSNRFQVIY